MKLCYVDIVSALSMLCICDKEATGAICVMLLYNLFKCIKSYKMWLRILPDLIIERQLGRNLVDVDHGI